MNAREKHRIVYAWALLFKQGIFPIPQVNCNPSRGPRGGSVGLNDATELLYSNSCQILKSIIYPIPAQLLSFPPLNIFGFAIVQWINMIMCLSRIEGKCESYKVIILFSLKWLNKLNLGVYLNVLWIFTTRHEQWIPGSVMLVDTIVCLWFIPS